MPTGADVSGTRLFSRRASQWMGICTLRRRSALPLSKLSVPLRVPGSPENEVTDQGHVQNLPPTGALARERSLGVGSDASFSTSDTEQRSEQAWVREEGVGGRIRWLREVEASSCGHQPGSRGLGTAPRPLERMPALLYAQLPFPGPALVGSEKARRKPCPRLSHSGHHLSQGLALLLQGKSD